VTDEVMRAIAALSGQEYVPEYQHNPEVPSHAKGGRAARAPPSAAEQEAESAVADEG